MCGVLDICIACIEHMSYTCFIHIIYVYNLHVYYICFKLLGHTYVVLHMIYVELHV